jgi:hypothetical protein
MVLRRNPKLSSCQVFTVTIVDKSRQSSTVTLNSS